MTAILAAARRRSIPNELSWGLGLAFITAVISGVSIFVNASAVRLLPDAAVFTTLKNGVAAVLLLALALGTVRPAERGSATSTYTTTAEAFGTLVVGSSDPSGRV